MTGNRKIPRRFAAFAALCLFAALFAAPALAWEEPLPTVRLKKGQSASVKLSTALVLPESFELDVEAPAELAPSFKDDVVSFSYEGGLEPGFHFANVSIASEEEERRVVLAVHVSNAETTKFSYKGKPGQKVFLAGSFNGWNNASWRLEDDGEGNYAGAWEIPGGSHTYKFVVDGDWIADPANPKQDASGHGNSVLEVGGASNLPRLFLLQSSAKNLRTMPPSNVVECLLVADGKPLSGAEVAVTALDGNAPLEAKYDAETGAVRFKLADLGANARRVRLYAAGTRPGRDGEAAPFQQEFRLVFPGHGPNGADWHDAIIYFAFTDRFFDGDPSNNAPSTKEEVGPLSNWLGGDLNGVTAKLRDEGYFEQLGVDTLWISPVFKNVQEAWQDSQFPFEWSTGYHAYWPLSSSEIEPHQGGADALKELVAEAHKQRKRVIVDFVSNHVHTEHPWYKEHPEWFGTVDLPNGEKNLRKFDEYPFTTWFDTFLASFDYPASPDARKANREAAIALLRDYDVDGFRHDAVKHVPHEFWRELTSEIRGQFEIPRGKRVYQVGETISGRGTIMDFVGDDLLDAQFDFPLYWSTRDAFAFETASLDSLNDSVLQSLDAYGEDHLMSNLAGNHDFSRFMAFADGDVPNGGDEKAITREHGHGGVKVDDPANYDKLELALGFVMTVPGVPMIYYGDEIGLTGAGDPDNRRMMLFGEDLSAPQMKLLERVRMLGRIRRDNPVFWTGSYLPLAATGDTLAFLRAAGNDKAIVAFNRSHEPATVSLAIPGAASPLTFQLVYSSEDLDERNDDSPTAFAEFSGEAKELKLPPRCVVIYVGGNPDPLRTWDKAPDNGAEKPAEQ